MALTMALASGIRTQAPSQPHTFHVYVDPIYGEDSAADEYNPFGASSSNGNTGPLQNHPAGASVIQGYLQHGPYSFRTVTAAIAWINTRLSQPGGPLPWENEVTHQTIDHLVIHCLPGLYGPRYLDPEDEPGTEEYDPRSGLPWNGETFPICLPDRVSIQGTSALDTIFDARGYDNLNGPGQNLFVFDAGITQNDPWWTDSFLDGIAMRGCRYDGATTGAAVLIQGSSPVEVLISNCFIYGNDVGIAMFETSSALPYHRPRIINDTIAWNHIGIVSSAVPPAQRIGYSQPKILNTILDPIRPMGSGRPPYLVGVGAGTSQSPSSFEGLDATDLDAVCAGPVPTQNFNAYHDQLKNLGGSWPFGTTTPRSGNPLWLPAVNLRPWTGDWNGGAPSRGQLYVNDVLRAVALSCAPHDFRLAPMASRAATPTTFVNSPLVNKGLDSASGLIQFANDPVAMPWPPGIPDDDLASFHSGDWDAEGFGNPRVAARRKSQTEHFDLGPCDSLIDIGADEMGELIVTGYVDSTRIFSQPHSSLAPNTASIGLCNRIYFLNVSSPDNTYIAPQFNVRSDAAPFVPAIPTGNPMWYGQLGWDNPFLLTGPDPAPPYAYTGGQHDDASSGNYTTRFVLTIDHPPLPPENPFPEFMRNRVCDFGPHLLDDIPTSPPTVRSVDYAEYDFQHVQFPEPTPPRRDIFQVNPWYDMEEASGFPETNDNKHLYIFPNPTNEKRLKTGHLTPPLAMFQDPLQVAFPKSYLYRDPPLHQLGYWGAPYYVYTVALNGLSAGDLVPYLPNLDWYGYRWNLELYDPGSSAWQALGSPVNNLQTSLVVEGDIELRGGAPQSSQRTTIADLTGQHLEREAEAVLLDHANRRRR